MNAKFNGKTTAFLSVFLLALMMTTELLTLLVLWKAQLLPKPLWVIVGCVMVMSTVTVIRIMDAHNPAVHSLRLLTGGVAAVCVTGACLFGSVAALYAGGSFGREAAGVSVAAEQVAEAETFAVYLSGSDTRSGRLTKSRSDVNLIAAVNPADKQILLVNTPRDYYVANPAGGGAMDKLAHCGLYGADNSRQALSMLYGVGIDYMAQINFKGFETLIDALGGVTVHSDRAFTTTDGLCSIHQGENTLNGAQALSFARERSGLGNGDRDRGENQMELLSALVRQVSPANLLGNYREILGSLEGMFATDMPLTTLTGFAAAYLTDLNEWEVLTCSVTGSDGTDYNYSSGGNAYVMYPDADSVSHAAALLQRVLEGEAIMQTDMD